MAGAQQAKHPTWVLGSLQFKGSLALAESCLIAKNFDSGYNPSACKSWAMRHCSPALALSDAGGAAEPFSQRSPEE